MKKILFGLFAAITLTAFMLAGCGHHHRSHSSSSVAPVGTINVVFQGNFPPGQQDQVAETVTIINNYFSQEVFNDFDITVVVVNTPVEECTGNCTHFAGPFTVVLHCGDFNELPELYEHLCHTQTDPDLDHGEEPWDGWKNRGHEVSCDIAKARGRKDCPHEE